MYHALSCYSKRKHQCSFSKFQTVDARAEHQNLTVLPTQCKVQLCVSYGRLSTKRVIRYISLNDWFSWRRWECFLSGVTWIFKRNLVKYQSLKNPSVFSTYIQLTGHMYIYRNANQDCLSSVICKLLWLAYFWHAVLYKTVRTFIVSISVTV